MSVVGSRASKPLPRPGSRGKLSGLSIPRSVSCDYTKSSSKIGAQRPDSRRRGNNVSENSVQQDASTILNSTLTGNSRSGCTAYESLCDQSKFKALEKWEQMLDGWKKIRRVDDEKGPPVSLNKPNILRQNVPPESFLSVGPSASIVAGLAMRRCQRCMTVPPDSEAKFCYRCGFILRSAPRSNLSVPSDLGRKQSHREIRGGKRSAQRSHTQPLRSSQSVRSHRSWRADEEARSDWLASINPRNH